MGRYIQLNTKEAEEVIRALELISLEDANANVHMEPQYVAAKKSALSRFCRVFNLKTPNQKINDLFKDGASVQVKDIK